MTASFRILHAGYVGEETPEGMHVGSTVTYAESGSTRVIVDPGLVASTSLILDPLRELGVDAAGITDVVFSHQHIDHTLNAALFPNACFHDFAAVYRGDLWLDADRVTGRPRGVHACLVVRVRPRRGPLRARPGAAARGPCAHRRPRSDPRRPGPWSPVPPSLGSRP